MTHPFRVVAVSGGLQSPSKSATLTEYLLSLIAEEIPSEQHLVELSQIAPLLASSIHRSELPDAVERELSQVEQVSIQVVTTPVNRGSYTGLFKHFFDFIDKDALVDKPVLLAATGGSERHAVIIDHQLRPLFSFFQARTLPLGVYATDKDFFDYRLQDQALIERARLAVQRALPLLKLTRQSKRALVDPFTVA